MSAVDSVNSSLYFSATALASKNVSQKEQDSKTEKTKKTKSFDNLFTEARQNIELDVSIPEIKGMTIEQAKEFLIDSVYAEGENLKQKPVEENLKRFRKAVTNFLKFVESQCYDIEEENEASSESVIDRMMFAQPQQPAAQPAEGTTQGNSEAAAPRPVSREIR